MSCARLALLFLLIFFSRTSLSEQNRGLVSPILTTARSAHQLTIKEAAQALPVHLHAVVTYYDPFIDPRRPSLFVTDRTGSIFVLLSTPPPAELKAGDAVEVTGVSGAGDFAPIVSRGSIRVIGPSQLPARAPRLSLTDLQAGEEDGQWVEVEGIVHAVRESGHNVFLDLLLRDGTLSAGTIKEPGADYSALIDARVSLRGNEAPLFNHSGQMTGLHLIFPNLSTLRVEQSAPAHPFDLPAEKVSSLLRYTPNLALQHRVHLRGSVTLFWPGRLLCIDDGSRGLCAQTGQVSSLTPGDFVDVIGFPTIGEFTPTLADASFQASKDHHSTAPLALAAEPAMRNNHDAELVTVEGRLIGDDRAANVPTLVLSSGNVVFSAVLPPRLRPEKLEEGSQLRLTGICSLQSDGATTIDFPVARSMRILLRSPKDIVVVRRPSWWNTEHTLAVLALALVTALAALGGVLLLVRRVKRQSLLLSRSEERFRYLATHDSLTRLPNRNAVLATLSSSLEREQEWERGVCVAIIDLDHFKHINDTFGHLAGDAVLRQTAIRLSSAVRGRDAIGRYGGEEFLVVLRHVDYQVGMERCEMIRIALGSAPIIFDGRPLPVTCSIGLAYADSPSVGAAVLIAQADDALYRAKTAGRNRVEFFSPDLALSEG